MPCNEVVARRSGGPLGEQKQNLIKTFLKTLCCFQHQKIFT
jgi:hypothetical protein